MLGKQFTTEQHAQPPKNRSVLSDGQIIFFPSVFVSPVIQGASNPCAVFAGKIPTVHTAALAGYFWLAFPSKPRPLAVFWGVLLPDSANQARGDISDSGL